MFSGFFLKEKYTILGQNYLPLYYNFYLLNVNHNFYSSYCTFMMILISLGFINLFAVLNFSRLVRQDIEGLKIIIFVFLSSI